MLGSLPEAHAGIPTGQRRPWEFAGRDRDPEIVTGQLPIPGLMTRVTHLQSGLFRRAFL